MAKENEIRVNSKEDFMKVTIDKISSVYNGKDDCCRCGCKGNYTHTTYGKQNTYTKPNDSLVKKQLNRAKKLIEQGAPTEGGGTYFSVTTGNDRCYTFYFDDLQ